MSARRATQIEQARLQVTALRFALIAYAGYPAAAARVAGQLEEARRALALVEGGGRE
jgi:hypothetical protein